jgi:hypothetical protein
MRLAPKQASAVIPTSSEVVKALLVPCVVAKTPESPFQPK